MVTLADQRSDKVRITLDVLQGFIIGPLLFILDIGLLEVSSKIILYADDTTVHLSGKSIASIAHNPKI